MNKIKIFFIATVIAIVAAISVGCGSAYDVAVKNGYSGTEQQWLESLKGKDGNDGSDLRIEDIYDTAKSNGFEGTYLDFLHEYLSIETGSDQSAAINKALRSAVIVTCRFERRASQGGSFAQAGSGVIYVLNKSEGSATIVTNYHVVYSSLSATEKISDDITITAYGNESISATYVGGSADYDIAVLTAKDEYFSTDFPIAVTVDKSDVYVGQTAIAIGNPAGEGFSATEGIISVDSEYIVMSGIENPLQEVSMRVMRVDAAVNSGNSGGGLFDSEGELIGIVNAKTSDTSLENMGYAIPASIVTAVADNIINNGTFIRGLAGITIEITESKAYLDDEGKVRIAETVSVREVSGASSGLLKKGDVIKSVKTDKGETEVLRDFHIIDALLANKPGDKVVFGIIRNGEQTEVEVTLGNE